MKKAAFALPIFVCLLLLACHKEAKEKVENHCQIIDASLVPRQVKDSFATRYVSTSVDTWFRKDSIGYCAYFISGGTKKLAEFSNEGTFVIEETDMDKNGHEEDSTSTVNGKLTGGCECEIPK